MPAAFAALLALSLAAVDCRALKDQRDALAREAMEAEIAVLHQLRLQICPREETADQADLDYGAYVRCRHQAEARLERTRPELYRNRLGFTFFTPAGARLARQADALLLQLEASPCSTAASRDSI